MQVRVPSNVQVRLNHTWDRGITIGIKANPRGCMGRCRLGAQTYGTWRTWTLGGHTGITYAPALDAHICAKRGRSQSTAPQCLVMLSTCPTRTRVLWWEEGGGLCDIPAQDVDELSPLVAHVGGHRKYVRE